MSVSISEILRYPGVDPPPPGREILRPYVFHSRPTVQNGLRETEEKCGRAIAPAGRDEISDEGGSQAKR